MTDTEIVRALAETLFDASRVDDATLYDSEPVFDPLTNDNDCMACVDKMADEGWGYSIYTCDAERPIVAAFWETDKRVWGNVRSNDGRDRRRTICIAILKALGEWREEP